MSGGGGAGAVIGGAASGAAGAGMGFAAGGGTDFGDSGVTGIVDDILTGGAGKKAAAAQERIAMAQLAEQRRTQDIAIKAANPSPQELQQLEQSIQLNTADIARKQKLVDSSDPALVEAGTQALKLLQGQDAATLDPIRRQREKERLKLQERLQAQLGSGFENSTAGLQALSAFDEATTNSLGAAQQQSLAQLLGVAQNTSSTYGLQNNISNAANISNIYGNQSNRMVNAITGNKIDASGAEFVGDLAAAKNATATSNTLLGLGATAAGAYYGAK